MNKCFVFFLCLLATNIAFSQQPVYQWSGAFIAANQYNPSVYSNGRSVVVDRQGNVYSAGLFNYTTDFDPGPAVFTLTAAGTGNTGIYLSKLSPTGGFVWAIQIPALVEFGNIEITIDKNDNVYIGSELRNAMDFDPGPDEYILTPIGAWDAFVAKYDPNGKLVWAKQFGGPGDTVPRTDVLTIDSSNNVIVCGDFNNTVDFDPGPGTYNITSTAHIQSVIVKLKNNGDFIWAKQFGNGPVVYAGSAIKDVKCDPQGNIYLVGNFAGLCDFDPGSGNYPLQATSFNDGYIAKLDANGGFMWARQIGNTTYDYYGFAESRGIALDKENNVYTTGNFTGTYDLDPGTDTHIVASSNYDWYVLKLNSTGNFVWADVLGGPDMDIGTDIDVDNGGIIYVTGSVGKTADMDPGPGVFNTTSQGIYGAAAMVKLNSSGSFLWAGLVDGTGSILLRRMMVKNENIYITGSIGDVVDFDFSPASGLLSGGGTEAPYVVKYGKCKNFTTSTLNINICDTYTLNNEVFDSAGTFIRTIMNSEGCDSIITLNLTVNKKHSERGITICEGESFFAEGKLQTTSGTYKDTLRSSLNCDSIVTTQLIVNPRPTANLGPDRYLCAGTQAIVSPGSFDQYLWQDGSTSNSLTVKTPGKYWVTVSNSFNCRNTDSLVVGMMRPLPSDLLKSSDSVCIYGELLVNCLKKYDHYIWSTGATQNSIVVKQPGEYSLIVTDTYGCVGTDSINVFPKECQFRVFIPTAFTPDNDGKNDIFRALVFGRALSFLLQIFDRSGQLIFQSTDPQKGWDGSNRGTPYSTSVFVWQCSYQLDGQQPMFRKGTVTVIR